MSARRLADRTNKPLDLWVPPENAGEPRVCIATTFTFDATFFEAECIGRFLNLDTHPSESDAVAYLIEREEKLAATSVVALVDRRHAKEKESFRWDVLGVVVPRAIQHAKISILAWANHIRIIVGSGNLTIPGYRKNLEVFGTIEIPQEGGDVESLDAALEFVGLVIDAVVGNDGPGTAKGRARAALAGLRSSARLVPRLPRKPVDPRLVFGRRGASVLAAVAQYWATPRAIRRMDVLSPFFDTEPAAGEPVGGVASLMARRGERDVYIYPRAEVQPDGSLRVCASHTVLKALDEEGFNIEVHPVLAEQKGEHRELHAKMVSLETDDAQALLIGSSNFTRGGLSLGSVANFEANLLYTARPGDPHAKALRELWPETGDPIDLDADGVHWNPLTEESEEGGESPPIPSCFVDAIFIPGPPRALAITIEGVTPLVWAIAGPDGERLVSSRDCIPETTTIDWGDRREPFVLRVTWETQAGAQAAADWPVNVSDPAHLAPPEQLRGLRFEELVEIIGSTRPLPAAVVVAFARRAKRADRGADLDPLRRFAPATFLRRSKRVATALDRLRERLEAPVLTREAFEWRLRGPVGPLAFAEAILAEEMIAGEPDFYIAELALALNRVRCDRAAKGGLPARVIKELLEATCVELRNRAADRSLQSTALRKYVEQAFGEALA